jgi:hypothetical protein
MSNPSKEHVQACLDVLDMYDRDYLEAVRVHHDDFPPYVPTERIERIAYNERKQLISILKKRLESMRSDYIAASLALLRLGG